VPDLRPILLVEDNPRDVELTMAALAKCQLANGIVPACDGAEALDLLLGRGVSHNRARVPAMVLPDLKPPKVDELEVLERIRSDAARRHIPVVMLTSSREERDLIRSYDLGVNAFVARPVDFGSFFEAVQDLGMFRAVLDEPVPEARGTDAD
jgi:CheY-like chemotaxis protein